MAIRRTKRQSSSTRSGARRGLWPVLLRKLQSAEIAQKAALAALATAERRFLALRAREKRRPPAWYRAAHDAAARAGEDLDILHHRIASTPAPGRQGMWAKVQLLAVVHGVAPETPVRAGDRDDLVACLIRSLIADLARKLRRRA